MSFHTLTIAKASLAASLIRPDPVFVPRDEIARFHNLLDAVLIQCSSANIQRCKIWMLEYAGLSSARVAAVGKYLAALSTSLAQEKLAEDNEKDEARRKRTNTRKQLHMLYLVHDLLHHTKFHGSVQGQHESMIATLQPHIERLVTSAASYDPNTHPKQHRRLEALIDHWSKHACLSESILQNLRILLETAHQSGFSAAAVTVPGAASLPTSTDPPYLLPATHGDATAPYFDLPAGTLLPHIVPNSAAPINPKLVRPLTFTAGPAPLPLVRAVQAFLRDADATYDPVAPNLVSKTVPEAASDARLRTELNPITGLPSPSTSYYGWSQVFCANQRRLATNPRSPSRSPPRKRSRYSVSSRSRSASRSASRSYSRSRSRSFSPLHGPGIDTARGGLSTGFRPIPIAQQLLAPVLPLLPPPLPPGLLFAQGIPMGVDGRPVPPPRPVGWIGLWPPIPPVPHPFVQAWMGAPGPRPGPGPASRPGGVAGNLVWQRDGWKG